MITTRDIEVDLNRRQKPLEQKTAKEVDVYVKRGKPKPSKIAVSTHNIEDVADIAEKARHDKIIANLKGELIDDKLHIDSTEHYKEDKKELADETKKKRAPSVYLNDKGKTVVWKELTAEEKKRILKERMAKVQAAKGKKK